MAGTNYAGIIAAARALDCYQGLRADVEIDRAWSEILDVLLRTAQALRAVDRHSVAAAALEVWLSGPHPNVSEEINQRDSQVYAVLAAAVGAGVIPPLAPHDDPLVALRRVESLLPSLDTTGWPAPARRMLADTVQSEDYRVVFRPVDWDLFRITVGAEIDRAAGAERVRQERRALACRSFWPWRR